MYLVMFVILVVHFICIICCFLCIGFDLSAIDWLWWIFLITIEDGDHTSQCKCYLAPVVETISELKKEMNSSTGRSSMKCLLPILWMWNPWCKREGCLTRYFGFTINAIEDRGKHATIQGRRCCTHSRPPMRWTYHIHQGWKGPIKIWEDISQ